jgi:hypothetical protein
LVLIFYIDVLQKYDYEYYCTKKIMSKFYKVNIKPLSVNKAWKGRRYATKESKAYQKELHALFTDKGFILTL